MKKPSILTCLGVNLVLILGIVLLKNHLPPQVPLLYGLPEGEGQLVPRLFLTLPSLMAIILTLINAGLSFWVKDIFLKKILLAAPILITFLAAVTSLKIIFLVGSF